MSAKYHAIGLMSGSSLDGLDIAYVSFEQKDNHWSYQILAVECLSYPPTLHYKLKTAAQLPSKELFLIHTQLGHFFGNAVKNFVSAHKLETLDFIASHGHTIFHDPENMMTCQIGDGAAIAVSSGFKTVSDLRSTDIAAGGQGAPIVPIGDQLLFSDYDAWLNIGGIANISLRQKNSQALLAFDICVANQILNFYANQVGKEFDRGGEMARSGKVDKVLFDTLNALDFYLKDGPKSLDNAYSTSIILPMIENTGLRIEDKLATYTNHIACQIVKHTDTVKSILVTGGGAFNHYLIEVLKSYSNAFIHIPDENTIQYKEALVMAFLGLLRILEKENVLASVTGARKNSINGAVYLPLVSS